MRPARPAGAPTPAFRVKEATPGMPGAGVGAAVVVVKAAARRVRVVDRRLVFISGVCVCVCVCVDFKSWSLWQWWGWERVCRANVLVCVCVVCV